MMTYIECPLIIVFLVCAFLGFAVDRLFALSGELEDLKKEVKELCLEELIAE